MTRALIALALAPARNASRSDAGGLLTLTPCAWPARIAAQSAAGGCDATRNIEVHHIYPQHLWPERATK